MPAPGVINRLTRSPPSTRCGSAGRRGGARASCRRSRRYFHPLDFVGDWNRVYGARSFLQYQFVVPFGAEQVLRTVIERISAASLPIFLTVLKRFGPGNPGMLELPDRRMDVGDRRRRRVSAALADLLAGLDRLVLDAGGRHYLAKDFQTTPDAVRRGYPRLDEWLAVRQRVDPTGVWASDLGRRLGPVPTR